MGFFGTGALLFFVGLRASQGRRVSGAIALLIDATYLATLGAGTASWRGYVSALSLPFWIAVGLAAIAVPLLITAWFSAKDKLEVRKWIGAGDNPKKLEYEDGAGDECWAHVHPNAEGNLGSIRAQNPLIFPVGPAQGKAWNGKRVLVAARLS